MKEEIIIFTDGASKGNPGPGGWGAIIAHINIQTNVDEGSTDMSQVFELGGGERNTTNNRMEMMAVIDALTYVFKNFKIKDQKIILYLDSSYVLKGATKWVRGWQESGWITKGKSEVLNKDLWEKVALLMAQKESDNIEWKLLSGHVGIAGNERADEIATGFAAVSVGASAGASSGSAPKLFSGPFSEYKIDILNISHDFAKKAAKKKSSSRSSAKAYSYISMVKGIIKTHATWAECEARVKGVSGSRFKKATSPEEEKEIIEDFKRS
jgi:ribonuclease HI